MLGARFFIFDPDQEMTPFAAFLRCNDAFRQGRTLMRLRVSAGQDRCCPE
jgi:hypothetical protein